MVKMCSSVDTVVIRAEESFRGQGKQGRQEDRPQEGVETSHAALELGLRALLCFLFCSLLALLLFLHDAEVEDAWNEHVHEWADDGCEDHPEVYHDVVWFAVGERKQDNADEKIYGVKFLINRFIVVVLALLISLAAGLLALL